MTKKQEKNELPINEAAITTRIEKKQVEERVAITAHVITKRFVSKATGNCIVPPLP